MAVQVLLANSAVDEWHEDVNGFGNPRGKGHDVDDHRRRAMTIRDGLWSLGTFFSQALLHGLPALGRQFILIVGNALLDTPATRPDALTQLFDFNAAIRGDSMMLRRIFRCRPGWWISRLSRGRPGKIDGEGRRQTALTENGDDQELCTQERPVDASGPRTFHRFLLGIIVETRRGA
jgi:hypothetical protein